MLKNIIIIILFSLPFISFAQGNIDSTSQQEQDTAAQFEQYYNEIDTTSLGSNLNLQAVAEIFRTSKDLEEFEKRLNDKEEGVNNFDLNGDGEIDYLRVVDHAKDNTHVIVIQAVLGKDKFQDVASIDIEQDGDNVSLQIVGDEEIYGTDYYVEPEKQEEVKDYPSVAIVFHVGYSPYYSPYHWGYYPPYFHPWRPYPPYYYHRRMYYHHHYHHHHYHHGHRPMHPHARKVHYNNHRSANINRPGYRPSNPNTRPSTRPVQKPQTRPSTRPSQRPQTRPSQKPQTRPSQRPQTKPSQKPQTRPSTRPSQKPQTRPTQPRPQQRPQTRPAQPRPQQRARPRPTGRPRRR